jgi:5-(hydroxymethyl)furfural/furfural oxidase
LDDYNADFRDGVASMPISTLPDRRVSASMAYLTKVVRRRPNLTILPGAFVERLDSVAGGVRGVMVRIAQGRQRILGHETVISCGALYSPALLLRSGIGPAAQLRSLGINVVRDLPGVGGNLQNHPQLVLAAHLPRASLQPRDQRAIGQNCLRYSSRARGCAEHDMGIATINKSSWHPLGRRIGAIAVCLYEPHSRGSVELASADPATPPRVRFNLLADQRDFARMLDGARFALELFADGEVELARNEVFLPNGKSVAELSRRSRKNWLQSALIASVLEIPPLRHSVLKKSTLDVRALARDDAALRTLVRQRTGLSHHVSCTCKMGAADDTSAVVDAGCRVRGVAGLRVVDPSIFPTIPRAGMHIPVLMAAEKMVDQIKADWRS